jgi:hypothetical protein
MTINNIAQIAHEINLSFCIATGDLSQLPWDQAPDWQKESAINGVKFHLQNIDATPADSHENWLREKEANGWKYGETKDVEKKEHPCMVPYTQLPFEQRIKDYLFKQVIKSLKAYLIEEEEGNRELTFGEMLAGVSFNPSKSPQVDELKRVAAKFMDAVNDMQALTMDKNLVTTIEFDLWGHAKVHALIAQMLTVKALTWNKN